MKTISPPALCGTILVGAFLVFYFATLLSWLIKGTWDARIAAAIASAPTSAIILDIVHPLLNHLGGYGSLMRDIAEWAAILGAGCIQYFSIGYVVMKIWIGYASE